MTLLSQLLTFFPAFVMAIALGCFLWLIFLPNILAILALIFILYIFPLLIYHLHGYFYPIKFGTSYLLKKKYSPWWGSYQIQLIYSLFPVLETILHLIPGLFSLWLRLWGAKIGRQVYWSPSVHIIDRGLIEVGDRVIFGHLSATISHVIKPKKNDLLLYVKPVKIGSNVFIGSNVKIAPGVVITDGEYIPFDTIIYPDRKMNNNQPDQKNEA